MAACETSVTAANVRRRLPAGSRVWGLGIAGAIAMFLVQPPADLWMLAWLAPLPWLALVQAPRLEIGRAHV